MVKGMKREAFTVTDLKEERIAGSDLILDRYDGVREDEDPFGDAL